jgi:hypothetical protein
MSRQPRIRRTAVAGAAAAVILIAAVVVLVNRSGGEGSPAANAATGSGRAAQLWHDVAQCLRTHGHPGVKDPVINEQGDPDFGAQGADVKRAVMQLSATTCRAQIAALPAAEHRRPPTTAELHQMVLFSRCMREHGLPDWPDPRADGTFPLNQRLMRLDKRGTRTQMQACLPLMGSRSKGIAISPSSMPPGSKKGNGE